MDTPVTEQTTVPNDSEDLNCWAVVEIFGHTKLAGRVSSRKMGTQVMIQVDVPEGEAGFSHSRIYNPSAIFSINPTTEQVCRHLTATSWAYNHKPIEYVPGDRQIEDDAEDREPES